MQTMQKSSSSRAFTLVELMIVIAIIGILAVVLYPSMTGYLEKTRDVNRKAGLQQIATALQAYQTDNGTFPPKGDTNCLGEIGGELLPSSDGTHKGYIGKFPMDPKQGSHHVTGCGTVGEPGYGYQSHKAYTDAADNSAYVLAANMEINTNGNFDGSTWASVTDFNALETSARTMITRNGVHGADTVTQGNWYYVIPGK